MNPMSKCADHPELVVRRLRAWPANGLGRLAVDDRCASDPEEARGRCLPQVLRAGRLAQA